MPTDITALIQILPTARLKRPFTSGTPSFLFKKANPNGNEFVFGANLELLDRADIHDGQTSRAVLHCWVEISIDDVPEGTELLIWYNREIGTARVDEHTGHPERSV